MNKNLIVCITGAAGQIAYSFIPQLLSGEIFGKEVNIDLRLLDIEPMQNKLKGIVCEIEDANFPVLKKV